MRMPDSVKVPSGSRRERCYGRTTVSDIELLSNKYLLILVSGVAGALLSWVTQHVLNKRGKFSYCVTHSKVGASTADPIFGNVSVSWNGNPIANLFFSTLELTNESLDDYEYVRITISTSDTWLLSESTNIAGTPYTLKWSDDYQRELQVEPGGTATQQQHNTYMSRREYVIPVFNRGQVVTMNYLNAAHTEAMPHLLMSANVKGAVLKYRMPSQQILGVPIQHAALAGTISGLAAMVPLVFLVGNPWVIASLALIYGLGAQFPGALLVKGLRFARQGIGN